MSEHPAAPLLAADLGRLQHTNAKGELGIVGMPGFNTAGMSEDQADDIGTLALAISEGVIETLEKKHRYRVIHESEIKAQVQAGIDAAGGPVEAEIALCKRCRNQLLRPGKTIDVPVMIAALEAHREVCR